MYGNGMNPYGGYPNQGMNPMYPGGVANPAMNINAANAVNRIIPGGMNGGMMGGGMMGGGMMMGGNYGGLGGQPLPPPGVTAALSNTMNNGGMNGGNQWNPNYGGGCNQNQWNPNFQGRY